MKKKEPKLLKYSIAIPLWFLIMIWSVKIYELAAHTSLSYWGILPREIIGLRGIFFMPFLHGSLAHTIHNSFPLFLLLAMLVYFYHKRALFIVLFGNLLTGLFTWLIGGPGYHIGASAMIYMLAGYLFFSGIFRKNIKLKAISLLIVFIYGGMIWGIFPFQFWIDQHISWEGHLSGALVGIILACWFRKVLFLPETRYSWEKEPENTEDLPYWLIEENEKAPEASQPSFKDLF